MARAHGNTGLSASALQLVEAAERLFATHGIEGASLRQIAAEAGSLNHSAVTYHFGTKDGLVQAIFEHRLPQIIHERRLLRTRSRADDLRSRLEAQFLPILMLADAPDNRYATFVEQLQRRHPRGEFFSSLPSELQQSNDEFQDDLDRSLADVDRRVRRVRIADAQSVNLHAAVDRETALASGQPVLPFDVFVTCLLDGIAGYLQAPASPAAVQGLADMRRDRGITSVPPI